MLLHVHAKLLLNIFSFNKTNLGCYLVFFPDFFTKGGKTGFPTLPLYLQCFNLDYSLHIIHLMRHAGTVECEEMVWKPIHASFHALTCIHCVNFSLFWVPLQYRPVQLWTSHHVWAGIPIFFLWLAGFPHMIKFLFHDYGLLYQYKISWLVCIAVYGVSK